jgi:hypothetical protein
MGGDSGLLCIRTGKGRAVKGADKIPPGRSFLLLPIRRSVMVRQGMPVENRAQAYYLSTGSSGQGAAGDFGGVLFPCGGRSESPHRAAWIIKQESLPTDPWRVEFCRLVDSFFPPIVAAPGQRYISCGTTYRLFLNKFRHWFQVQQSAAFGGEFWSREDLAYLRELALLFSWNPLTNRFEPDADITQRYRMPTTCVGLKKHESSLVKNAVALAKEFNDLLKTHHALTDRVEDSAYYHHY